METSRPYGIAQIREASPRGDWTGLPSDPATPTRPGPAEAGPIRLSLDAVPEANRADTLRELIARSGIHYDVAEPAYDGVPAGRLLAIKQDIAGLLDRADLSVAALAARHACTPRFIQRLFASAGTTFTEYVLAQRLARARAILVDPRRAGEKVSTVAYDCGFGNVSYFNRAFRRRYGAAPSETRAQARDDAADRLM
jgi:AraC-like DNA-binding protein